MKYDEELIIFCDESEVRGRFFSNFYGGLVIGSSQYERVDRYLNDVKEELNLFGEVKWEKVTCSYLEKYVSLISAFFKEVRNGRIKIRIMFTQNAHVPLNLSHEDHEMGYFKLYYQFIKYAFWFQYLESDKGTVNLRLYFDQFPHTLEKVERFRGYLLGLNRYKEFQAKGFMIKRENIAEVKSHKHVLLQCLDFVLGAVAFRLNDKHRNKPAGAQRRGKRTIAKEKLYRHILAEISKIRPNFNIGESTSIDNDWRNRWVHPYRHWKFVPRESEFRPEKTKKDKKKNSMRWSPTLPTSVPDA